jgi:hypothetical protein
MSWVTVNLPFRLTRSPEAADLGQKFCAAVDAAKARWRAEHPEQINLTTVDGKFDEVFEVQNQYPWLRGHLDAPNLETWRDESLRKADDAPPGLRVKIRALVIHRYWYRLENDYINNEPGVVEAQAQCFQQREREHNQQFCNHPMCKTGVLIEVATPGDQGPPRQLLIGDVNAYGTDGGCCPTGLNDDEIITRYKDFSYILKDV